MFINTKNRFADTVYHINDIQGNEYSFLGNAGNLQMSLEQLGGFITENNLESDYPFFISDSELDKEREHEEFFSENYIDLGDFAFVNSFRDCVKEDLLDDKDLLAYVSSCEFLQPQIIKGEFYQNIETEETVEKQFIDDFDVEKYDFLGNYNALVTANGYLDTVNLGYFDTEKDAIASLLEYYCD